jgi:hypothetical protein
MIALMKRKWWLLLSVMALVLIFFGAMSHRVSPLSRAFDEIQIGMTGEQARKILAGVFCEAVEISICQEKDVQSLILNGKSGEMAIIRFRRNGTKILDGCIVGKEYCSSFMVTVRDWIDSPGRWLRPARVQQAKVGTGAMPVRPAAPRGPFF